MRNSRDMTAILIYNKKKIISLLIKEIKMNHSMVQFKSSSSQTYIKTKIIKGFCFYKCLPLFKSSIWISGPKIAVYQIRQNTFNLNSTLTEACFTRIRNI